MGFDEARFRQKVDKAMEKVHKLLDLNRTPRYAEDEDHVYDDKYGMAEFLTNSALAAQLNVLKRMGLSDGDKSANKLQKIMDMVHRDHRSVTLRLSVVESCQFLKEKVVDIDSPRQARTKVTESKSWKSRKKETSYQRMVATEVKEYHWKFGVSYALFVFAGNDPWSEDSRVILQSRESSTVLITTGDKQQEPLPERNVRPPIDAALTWLLQNLTNDDDKEYLCNFHIDRTKETCQTPRRNDDIQEAMKFFTAMTLWSHLCRDYFVNRMEREILGLHHPAAVGDGAGGGQPRQLFFIDAEEVFVPVLPLMEAPKENGSTNNQNMNRTTSSGMAAVSSSSGDQSSPLLSLGDVNRFLNEQQRSLDEAISSLAKEYPNRDEMGQVLSVAEATQIMLCLHTVDIKDHWFDGVDYIEQMLRKQVVAAIGKEVQTQDFDEFIRFNNQKLLGAAYKPRPFCYAIRRPDHYPDGVLSIEASSGDTTNDDDSKNQPIESIVHKLSADIALPMFIPINAATSIEFTGERYLHGWVQQRFGSINKNQFKLIARARQFSSFLLMVGTIAGPEKFDPKDAIILQNKDEVLIPLILNELPTAKEFKDAISSLSPEQQRFAKSFRGMQLESSVFGVCVVQLKPQLESLLRLPSDALTKEIGLTQDLLSLFIDYQVPSDLLSFDGAPDAPVMDKVDAVKGYVKAVKEVIDIEKSKQLEAAAKEADMRAEAVAAWSPSTAQYFGGSAPPAVTPAAQAFNRTSVPAFQAAGAFPFSSSMAPALNGTGPVAREATVDLVESDEEEEYEESVECDDHTEDTPTVDSSGKTANTTRSDELTHNVCRADSSGKSINMSQHDTLTHSVGLENKINFTAIPRQLNATFEKHDTDNALRTNIIKAGDKWTRMRQPYLAAKVTKKILSANDQKTEKNKAFDLLDALSRSGTLPIAWAELHVVLGVTHCFENTVMGTVIEQNVNPIEKVEKSTLLIASTIHGVEVPILLGDGTAGSASPLMDQFTPALTEEASELCSVD